MIGRLRRLHLLEDIARRLRAPITAVWRIVQARTQEQVNFCNR